MFSYAVPRSGASGSECIMDRPRYNIWRTAIHLARKSTTRETS